MSIASLEPATRTLGGLASTASAGSFCLFCENGEGGLPLLTSTSGFTALAVVTAAMNNSSASNTTYGAFRIFPPQDERMLGGAATAQREIRCKAWRLLSKRAQRRYKNLSASDESMSTNEYRSLPSGFAAWQTPVFINLV